mgnify:CR=1 FL=1
MKIFLGICFLLFLSGCGSDESEAEAEAEAEAELEVEGEVELEGQVFAVTKSRENIKMGLVSIHVVPHDQFEIIAAELVPKIMVFREEGAQQKANQNAREELVKELMALEKPDLTVPVLKTLREEATSAIEKTGVQNRSRQSFFFLSYPLQLLKQMLMADLRFLLCQRSG